MVDLRNICILVKTEEENEMLLKEAEKQGFHWYSKGNCKPLPGQHFPDILKFCNNKDVVHSVRIEVECDAFYEASELIGTKEMTAREFIEWYINMRFLCKNRICAECVLSVTVICAIHATGKVILMNFSKLRNQAFNHPK